MKLGSCSLCLAAAVPARVSLQARLAGPVLLREKCALPLTVVSTGDTLDDAELSFRVRRPENGEDENENAFSSVSMLLEYANPSPSSDDFVYSMMIDLGGDL